jgi:hypothetical protein
VVTKPEQLEFFSLLSNDPLCLYCNKSFKKTKKSKKYCCESCRRKDNYHKKQNGKKEYLLNEKFTCPICNRSFRKTLKNNKKYCSRTCLGKNYRLKNPKEKKEREKIVIDCIHCNKPIKTSTKNRKYCSNKCRYKKNKKKILSQQKKYFKKNKKEILKKQKEYFQKNKKDILRQNNEYYHRNKEEISKRNKKSYRGKRKKIEKEFDLLHKDSICPICNNSFKRPIHHPHQKYCSNKCCKTRYRKDNPLRGKEYYFKNKKRIGEQIKEYRNKNKEIIRERYKRYLKNNINVKLKRYISSRIRDAVVKCKTTKCGNTLKLLGCSIEHARKHLESQFKEGMTWENYGKYGWHIDHIIPCASFDLTDPEQQKKCFNYKNLQPLWWQENLSKGSKILN